MDTGPAKVRRQKLREKGQFWTPDWIADAMVNYVVSDKTSTVFDPGVGAGSFFRAVKRVAHQRKQIIIPIGTEIDPSVLQRALADGQLTEDDLRNIKISDFMRLPQNEKFDSIVANPPYIRHHLLSEETKSYLKSFGKQITGVSLDGRAGYHVYFLIKALSLLSKNGRLCFIMPADTCEGKFSNALWNWISRKYSLNGVLTFEPHATPFPGVDTNPVILMIENHAPREKIYWARCNKSGTKELSEWMRATGKAESFENLQVITRDLHEAVQNGLSRPINNRALSKFRLKDFARVMRGIATGDNDFFFMTRQRAEALRINKKFLLPAIGRTRDVNSDEISETALSDLERKGRPTYLLSLDNRPIEDFSSQIQDYLRSGERSQINKKSLISKRNPWYKMEVRSPPPFLFSYLGRRNARFIKNNVGVVPLTGFLCIYPNQDDPAFIEGLWKILQNQKTLENLKYIGKSYGQGAIKVEPRSLEELLIPEDLVQQYGISLQTKTHYTIPKLSAYLN